MQEYIEREDEFDINPRPDEKPSGACANGKDDEELDVETAEPIEALYCSSDEDVARAPPRLHHLPLEIEPQRPSTPECAVLSFPSSQRSLHLCQQPALQYYWRLPPFTTLQCGSGEDYGRAVQLTAPPPAVYPERPCTPERACSLPFAPYKDCRCVCIVLSW